MSRCEDCKYWRQNHPPDSPVYGICNFEPEGKIPMETSSIFGCADFERAEWATDSDINWMDVREVVLDGRHKRDYQNY